MHIILYLLNKNSIKFSTKYKNQSYIVATPDLKLLKSLHTRNLYALFLYRKKIKISPLRFIVRLSEINLDIFFFGGFF